MKKEYLKQISIVLLTTFLTACGGGGGGSDGTGSVVTESVASSQVGNFIDSAVEGLTYETATYTGITDQNGEFKYLNGEKIKFFIGTYFLGEVTGKAIVTPYSLYPNDIDAAVRVAQLLQTIDSDNNPNNGIILTNQARFSQLDNTVSPSNINFESELNSKLNLFLISKELAKQHLDQTISGSTGSGTTGGNTGGGTTGGNTGGGTTGGNTGGDTTGGNTGGGTTGGNTGGGTTGGNTGGGTTGGNPLSNDFHNIRVDTLAAGETRTVEVNIGEEALYSLKDNPDWMHIDSETGVITFTTPLNSTADYSFSVVANVNGKKEVSNTIRGKIVEINLYTEGNLLNPILREGTDTQAGLSTVRSGNLIAVPNNMHPNTLQENTWDYIMPYFKDYKRNIELVIVDGQTGAITKKYADNSKWAAVGQTIISKEGNLYIMSNKSDGTMKPQVNIYNPKTNELKLDAINFPSEIIGTEYNWMEIATDGTLMVGTFNGGSEGDSGYHNPRVFEINTVNNTIISGSGNPIGARVYPWKIAADADYIYVLSGKVPWRVHQYNRHTHAVSLVEESRTENVNILQTAYGVVLETGGSSGKHWFMYKGNKYFASNTDDWRRSDMPWPFPTSFTNDKKWYTLVQPKNIVNANLPEKAKVHTENAGPINGKAELWIKQPSKSSFKKHSYTLQTYPRVTSRIIKRADGKIMAITSAYGPIVTFDPRTNKAESALGDLSVSAYTMIEHKNKIYISGYPSGTLYEYDYAKPWTQGTHDWTPESEDISYTDQNLNPRWCGKLSDSGSGAHKMFTSAKGEGDELFFGGQWMRNGQGGGLAWYNTQTGESGGIWEEFSNYAIQHITALDDGKYLAISTIPVSDSRLGKSKPTAGRLFLFNTRTKKVEAFNDPMSDVNGIPGQIIGVDNMYVVGMSNDPEHYADTYVYRVNMRTGVMDYKIKFSSHSFTSSFAIGNLMSLSEEGKVITWIGAVVVEIDPISGDITPLAQYTQIGKNEHSYYKHDMSLYGNDIYIAGNDTIIKLEKIK